MNVIQHFNTHINSARVFDVVSLFHSILKNVSMIKIGFRYNQRYVMYNILTLTLIKLVCLLP